MAGESRMHARARVRRAARVCRYLTCVATRWSRTRRCARARDRCVCCAHVLYTHARAHFVFCNSLASFRSFVPPFIPSIIHSFIHTLSHSLIHSFIHPFPFFYYAPRAAPVTAGLRRHCYRRVRRAARAGWQTRHAATARTCFSHRGRRRVFVAIIIIIISLILLIIILIRRRRRWQRRQ